MEPYEIHAKALDVIYKGLRPLKKPVPRIPAPTLAEIKEEQAEYIADELSSLFHYKTEHDDRGPYVLVERCCGSIEFDVEELVVSEVILHKAEHDGIAFQFHLRLDDLTFDSRTKKVTLLYKWG